MCGLIQTEDGKEKKVCIDMEPCKPILKYLYMCDDKFHTDALLEMFDKDDEKYGFIVIDGNGCLFATVQGNQKTILFKFTVDLPNKHGRGGQSALRFARLRLEKRHQYVCRCCEYAIQYFYSAEKGNIPIIAGLILAGSADFKSELHRFDPFSSRFGTIVLDIVDVAYGMESGLNQAIASCADLLQSVKLVKEKTTLSEFYREIAADSGLACYGIQDTMTMVTSGLVSSLIVWDNLPINRVVIQDESTSATIVVYESTLPGTNTSEAPKRLANHRVVETTCLAEWLIDNYSALGVVSLHLISNKTPEGSQFCSGFGGLGGKLYWKCSAQADQLDDDNDNDEGNAASGDKEDDDGCDNCIDVA